MNPTFEIHRGVPIPRQYRKRISAFNKRLIDLILSDTMKVGDMVLMPNDCSTVRQKLYEHDKAICVRHNANNRKFMVWRTK